MKPAPFDYVRANSVEHAVTQLGEANVDGEGKIIAGGQSLMPRQDHLSRTGRGACPA